MKVKGESRGRAVLVLAVWLTLFIALTRGIAIRPEIAGTDVLFVLGWAVSLASLLLVKTWEGLRLTPLVLGAIAFAAGILIANLANGVSLMAMLPYLNYLQYLWLSWFLARFEPLAAARVIAAALTFHVLFASVELATGQTYVYSSWKLLEATFVGGVPRVSSTVGDPNYFALALIVLIGLLLHFRRTLGLSRRYELIAWLGIITVPFTFSRGGLVALAILFIALVIQRPRFRGAVAMLTVPLLATVAIAYAVVDPVTRFVDSLFGRFAAIFQADASLASRFKYQELGFSAAIDAGILGLGPGGFNNLALQFYDPTRPLDLQSQVLNTYLEVYLVGGLSAFLGLSLMFGAALRRQNNVGLLFSWILAAVAVVLFTLDTLQFVYLWTLIGVGLGFKSGVPRSEPIRSDRELQQRGGSRVLP